MRLRDLLEKLDGLPPDTEVCVAEVDEAFATELANAEVVATARVASGGSGAAAADYDIEGIDLEGGDQTVVVLRW